MPSSPLPQDAPRSLPAAFLRTAAGHPDPLAAVWVDGDVQFTSALLATCVRAVAADLANSFGKNMSPVNIEAALTTAGPWIGQAVVIGDGRRYSVALLGCRAPPSSHPR